MAAWNDDGIQILKLTDSDTIRSNPAGAGKIVNTGSLELDGTSDVVTFEASDGTNTNTYAAVTAFYDDGVQILKLTSGTALLSNPAAAGRIGDSGSLELDGAYAIAIFEASDGTNTNTYAAVTAFYDDGVQILKTDERHRAALQSGRRRKDSRTRPP